MNQIKLGWRTEAIRLTAFWLSPDLVTREHTGSVLSLIYTDVEPDSTEIKKGDVFRQETATLGPGKVQLSVSSTRIDIVWRVEDLSSDAHLGEPSDALDIFVTRAAEWFSQSSQVIRVALGLALTVRVDSIEAANKFILNTVGFINPPEENITDFALQINRPHVKPAGGENMLFNKLEKWGSQKIEEFVFNLTTGAPTSALKSASDPICVVTHELDLNTDAARVVPLSTDAIKDSYAQLLSDSLAFL